MIQAVVFDLDDTLYPEREFVHSGFRAVDEWLQAQHGIGGFLDQARSHFAAGNRGRVFDAALESLRVPAGGDLIQQMVRVYRAHKPRISVYPDAQEAIARLHGQKLLGIITDGYLLTQQNKVAALGIAGQFDAVIYSDAYGREHWKPDPLPYRRFMEASSCGRGECVYAGDNPRKDFVAARKLGWMTVQVCRPDGEYGEVIAPPDHQADFRVNSLKELEQYL